MYKKIMFFLSIATIHLEAALEDPLRYQAKEFSYLIGKTRFKDDLLNMHFQLYQGYIKNTNLLLARLKELEVQGKELSYEYGALKRRFSWEYDGMRLHELYFENLGGEKPINTSSSLYQEIIKEFGSYEKWKQGFIATGKIRGIGWVILYQDLRSNRLMNTWIDEHDLGHLTGGEPLLVMDVFEHAYITQYRLNREQYIDDFFHAIDWRVVENRYGTVNK
ncbi:MAG: Fe-Mn family superoxide dismutase [Chlamydiales bacterium]|jgi:Fe-Mn family superoxide dismutase|nr:Fe-Mn family superoxide dismutase [Chlamydiales bacterium]